MHGIVSRSRIQKIDTLDDSAIALLDDSLSADLKSEAGREAHTVVELADRFGFPRAARIARKSPKNFQVNP